MRGINFHPSLVLACYASFDLSLTFPFVFHAMVLAMDFLILQIF